MLQSSIKAGAMGALAILTIVGPASALAPVSLKVSARLVIPIQNEENQEIWRDLETGETPPEAAVGNEGQAQAPREWERATNLSTARRREACGMCRTINALRKGSSQRHRQRKSLAGRVLHNITAGNFLDAPPSDAPPSWRGPTRLHEGGR